MLKLRLAALAAALVLPASLALAPPAAGQQKTTIGVSLAQDDNPFYIAMLRGIRARAQELGWEVATVSANEDKLKQINGVTCEPYEALTVDVEEAHQGGVMEALGQRRAEMKDMQMDGRGRVRIDYRVPARGLIGFQGEFMNLTRGSGLMSHVFDGYAPLKGEVAERRNGVLISMENGVAVAYALWGLQERGRLFVSHNEKLYEGMIIGIHSRENDLVVNPIKSKKLTNVRASGKDDAILLTPPIELTLEYAVEFIADDELVEVTPESIRIRKRFLTENERKRSSRAAEAAFAE